MSEKKITFTKHAREAVVKRELDEKSIIDAVNAPDKLFLDRRTGRMVAVKRNGQALVVVYDVIDGEFEMITAFRTSKPGKLIRRKLGKGYWVRVR